MRKLDLAFALLLGGASCGGALAPRVLLADETGEGERPADALARKIDAHLDARLAKAGLEPAAQATDAELLRRISLDLVGTPPSPDEVVDFLASSDPDKRAKKIDELLARPEFTKHWAEVWTDIVEMEAKGVEGNRESQLRFALRDWFRTQLEKDTPFDEVVRRLLTSEGFLDENGAVGYFLAYSANNRPDAKQLTATTARVFMGLQIECAQCHDHPFADWKQHDFMGMAAFFARVRPAVDRDYQAMVQKAMKEGEKDKDGKAKPARPVKKQPRRGVEEANRGELIVNEKNEVLDLKELRKLVQDGPRPGDVKRLEKGKDLGAGKPGEKKDGKTQAKSGAREEPKPQRLLVEPTFIVASLSPPPDAKNRRDAFARMVTDPRNPYFRKAVANKLWTLLLGRCLVAPADDLSEKSAQKDPELLELLDRGLLALKHDLRETIRAIARTRAYGRTSAGPADAKLESTYAKSVVRPIDGRPLARTLVSAVFLGERGIGAGDAAKGVQEGRRSLEEQLLARFELLFGETNVDPRRYEETIPQALKIMFGAPMAGAGRKGRDLPQLGPSPAAALGRLLARYDDARERITRIYLASLARPPKKPELEATLRFVAANGDGPDAYEDVLWCLLNSAEFRFNR